MQFGTSYAAKYSAKKMAKPIRFRYIPTGNVTQVCVAGDFNEWSSEAHPMSQHFDGSWFAEIPMHHGHHRYVFLVDGEVVLDPEAQGVTRNEKNERVSLLSVS